MLECRPMRSMTAFVRKQASFPGGILSIELRSVNHRYLDLSLRLPELLRGEEMAYRNSLRKHLERGKIDISFSVLHDTEKTSDFSINYTLAKQWIAAATELNTLLPEPSAIALKNLMNFPGVLSEKTFDGETLVAHSHRLLEAALEDLNGQRLQEGAALQEFFKQALEKAKHFAKQAQALVSVVQEEQRQRLLQRLHDLGITTPEPYRFEQELAFLLQKSDVAEELLRLNTHLEEVGKIIAGKHSMGRRLDFMMQELHRETNTLGSKSSDVRLTQIVVDLKVLIEQMREQVQNLE